MHPEVPLVIPEVNPDDVTKHNGILAIPNCSTTPVVMTLWPVHQRNPVKRIIASTYQLVSGTGWAASEELRETTANALAGKPIEPKIYKHHITSHRIAFNLIPEIGSLKDDGYTSEELKMAKRRGKSCTLLTSPSRRPAFAFRSSYRTALRCSRNSPIQSRPNSFAAT